MSNRRIVREIKLENSVKLILALIAVGLIANPFMQMFGAKNALAELYGAESFNVKLSGSVTTYVMQ